MADESRDTPVVLSRIYTRTGDDGTTALGSGARRKKYDLRVSAYGTLDAARPQARGQCHGQPCQCGFSCRRRNADGPGARHGYSRA